MDSSSWIMKLSSGVQVPYVKAEYLLHKFLVPTTGFSKVVTTHPGGTDKGKRESVHFFYFLEKQIGIQQPISAF